jgi:hypothetical protein
MASEQQGVGAALAAERRVARRPGRGRTQALQALRASRS